MNRAWLVGLWVVLGIVCNAAPLRADSADGSRIIVDAKDGYPALTQHMLDRAVATIEWALAIRFTPEQRQTQQAFIIDHFRRGDARNIGGMIQLMELDRQLQAMTPQQRDELAQKARPNLLETFRQEVAEGDCESQWLLEVYETYHDRAIVHGDGRGVPPLTPSMLRRYAGVMQLAWDLRLTDAQRQTLDQQVIGHWQRRNMKDIEAIRWWLQVEEQATAASESQRILVSREQLYPEVLKQAKLEAANDPDVRWMLAVHDEFHRPLTAGPNPLTRRQSEAFLEVLFFAASTIEGGGWVRPTAPMLEEWNGQLAANWERLPAEVRAGVEKMGQIWLSLLAGWDQLPPDEQESIRRMFSEIPQVGEIVLHIRTLREQEQAQAEQIARNRREGYARSEQRARSTPAGGAEMTSADYLKLQQDLYWQQQETQMISNMMHQMHQSRMMIIYNMGNGYTWEYRHR